MADRAVKEWRFHVGAHKTGSTHLQRTLEAKQDALRRNAVAYLPLKAARPILQPRIYGFPYPRPTFRLLKLIPGALQRLLRRRGDELGRLLQAAAPPGATLLVSEENLLKHPWRWSGNGPLYPDLRPLHYLAALSEGAPVKIYFSIRSLDDFVCSYYCEALKRQPLTRNQFDAKVDALVRTPPTWVDLVNRIGAAVPNARITVWNYDDYRRHARAIHDALCGCVLPHSSESGAPTVRRSPSARAVRRIEALGLERGPDRTARVREILDEDLTTTPDEKFNPLTRSTRRLLRAHFDRDLEAIEQRFPGMLMRFDAA